MLTNIMYIMATAMRIDLLVLEDDEAGGRLLADGDFLIVVVATSSCWAFAGIPDIARWI